MHTQNRYKMDTVKIVKKKQTNKPAQRFCAKLSYTTQHRTAPVTSPLTLQTVSLLSSCLLEERVYNDSQQITQKSVHLISKDLEKLWQEDVSHRTLLVSVKTWMFADSCIRTKSNLYGSAPPAKQVAQPEASNSTGTFGPNPTTFEICWVQPISGPD